MILKVLGSGAAVWEARIITVVWKLPGGGGRGLGSTRNSRCVLGSTWISYSDLESTASSRYVLESMGISCCGLVSSDRVTHG